MTPIPPRKAKKVKRAYLLYRAKQPFHMMTEGQITTHFERAQFAQWMDANSCRVAIVEIHLIGYLDPNTLAKEKSLEIEP